MPKLLLSLTLTLLACAQVNAQESQPTPSEQLSQLEAQMRRMLDELQRLKRTLPNQEDALREQIQERYRARVGEDMDPHELDEALDEVLERQAEIPQQVAERLAQAALRRKQVGTLKAGQVVLQARSGAIGGNPCTIDMIKQTSPYIRSGRGGGLLNAPIPFKEAVGIHEPQSAYAQGGYIPKGKAFLITKISCRGVAHGDSNGGGEFKVRVGGTTIVDVSSRRGQNAQVTLETWKGKILIQAGKESSVVLQVSNSSAGEVTLEGTLVDAAPAAKVKRVWGPSYHPRLGTSISSSSGQVVVQQGATVLWQGPGKSATTRRVQDQGQTILEVVVDGVVVTRCRPR